MNKKNDHCSYEHLTVVLRHTYITLHNIFKPVLEVPVEVKAVELLVLKP